MKLIKKEKTNVILAEGRESFMWNGIPTTRVESADKKKLEKAFRELTGKTEQPVVKEEVAPVEEPVIEEVENKGEEE